MVYLSRMTAPAVAAMSSDNQRTFIAEVASRLHAALGRRKMYSAAQVEAAVGDAKYPLGWAMWAVAVFCTDAEFADYCARRNLQASYRDTRATALGFLDGPGAARTGHLAARVAGASLAAAALVATSSPVAAQQPGLLSTTGNVLSAAGDALDVAEGLVDIVGGVFDFLGIFS
jgi:hypothetical protein